MRALDLLAELPKDVAQEERKKDKSQKAQKTLMAGECYAKAGEGKVGPLDGALLRET